MSRSKLIVLHGMGVHSAEATKEIVLKAANDALQRYSKYQQVKFEDHVHVIGIGYDDLFEAERKRLVENNTRVSDFLAAGNIDAGFVQKIVDLEASIGEDKFFNTHALDVIFYVSLLGERVRLRVIKEIADVWADWDNEEMHILAHSLGTGVLHDTLHKGYTDGIDGVQLNPVTHKFDSLWTFANVSNLIYELTPLGIKFDPYDSVVRPSYSAEGCTEEFYNYWHALDPFTLFHRFAPENDHSWVPEVIYDDLFWQKDDGLRYVGGSLNPHDLYEYIANPYVSFRFLNRLLPRDVFNPDSADIEAADNQYQNLQGEFDNIKQHIDAIDSIDDIGKLIEAVKQFEDYLKTLGDSA